MVDLSNSAEILKTLINNKWSGDPVDVYIEGNESGKAINKRADNEISITASDTSVEADDIFKNTYDKRRTHILQIRSTTNNSNILNELIRVLGENTSSKDIPDEWETINFETVNIPQPRFNNYKATLSVTLVRTGDKP